MLTANHVKPCILHQERALREFALEYLQDSESRDADIMGYVLRALESISDERDRRSMLLSATHFEQTRESMEILCSHMVEQSEVGLLYQQIFVEASTGLLKQGNRILWWKTPLRTLYFVSS